MIKFKDIPKDDKPRERLYNYGEENLSNEELLSIILKTGTKGYSVKEVSLKLLESLGDITKLRDIGINTLVKIDGIGKVKAMELKAAIELGRRVYSNNKIEDRKFKNPKDIYNYFYPLIGRKKQEHFYCLYLDKQQNYIDKKCLFIGTIDNSVAHPREIFKEAYLLSASKIVCIHNHPSGDVTPSKNDIYFTIKIKEISIIHGIDLIDHIIIGHNNYYSFHDNNKL